MNRRLFLRSTLGFTASAAGLAFAGTTGRSLASPTQSHRILDLELFDVERQRPVPARLYLPGRASPSEPAPLVVFSHGLGGSRRGYSYLGSHWADAGIASLHPQHVGSDNALWRGNPLEMVQRLQSAARESEALARVLDVRFAMDQLLASESSALIDASRMAVAGHSYGANTAMLVSGARVSASGTGLADLQDPRVRAAILISAPPLLGQGPVEQVLGAVSIPTLHVTSVDDTINIPGYRSTVEDRIAIFEAMRASPKTLAVFNTGGHSIFTDRTTRSGVETSARIKSATRELSMLFLRQALRLPASPGPSGQGFPLAQQQNALELQADRTADTALREWQQRQRGLLDRFVTLDSAATNTYGR